MSLDGPTDQFDGELPALQHTRKMEALSTSPVSTALSRIADVAGEFGVPGVGLFAKALRSGQTPVEKVVEQLEDGAYAEIARIWKHLEGRDAEFEEFNARLQSREAQSVYFSAALHGLRTSDPNKHLRLGALTINSVYVNDLKPESLDDMMRAAVELKGEDILVLSKICLDQEQIMKRFGGVNGPEWGKAVDESWRQAVARSRSQPTSERKLHNLDWKSSLSRLAALGFLISVPTESKADDPHMPYGLLLQGFKFIQRLKEIG